MDNASNLPILGTLILLCLPLCAFVSRRTGIFSPAATAANFCLACMAFAFFVWWQGWERHPIATRGISYPIRATPQSGLLACYIYAGAIALTFCSTYKLRLRKKPATPAKVDGRANAWRLKAKRLARHALKFHTIFAPALLFFAACHLLFVFLPNLSSFAFASRSNILFGPLLVTSALFCYYAAKLPRKTYALFYFLVFLYALVVNLAAYSRILPVTCVVCAFCVASDSTLKKKRNKQLAVGALFILAVYFLNFALLGRTERDEGFNFGYVWQSLLLAADPSNLIFVTAALFNIFNGTLLLAECLDIANTSYPLRYELLSMSPLPSFLDGWNNALIDQVRVNFYTPFSAFAEWYYFRIGTQIALMAIYFFCVRTMTRFYTRNFGWARVLTTAVSVVCWVIMHQYFIRNMFRAMLFTTAFCLVLGHFQRKAKRREARRAELAAYSPMPALTNSALPAPVLVQPSRAESE